MPTFKRKVFYLGGFDPRGVRFYYALYREVAARWAERTGRPLAVGPRRRASPFRVDWTVANEAESAETSYSFLRWEDIVQRAWIRRPLTLIRATWRTYRGHWRFLDRAMLSRLPGGPIVTLAYPPIVSLLLPVLLALPVALLLLLALRWWIAWPVALVAAAIAARPILKRWHTGWLLRFFIFNGELAENGVGSALAERLDGFAADIAAALDEPWDEVLLITHSNGSILSVPLMARLLDLRAGQMPDRFALVTLGHCIPLVSCRRDAAAFQDQLERVTEGEFRWFDIGSPPDGAAFHAVNPMTRPDLPDPAARQRPRLDALSPRFHLFYDAATYHKGLANKYEIHFDYLRVGDRVSPIDYPSLTAGGRPIEASVATFRAIA